MSDQNPVFIPGPTNVPERLRRAMNAPTIDHRAPNFVELLGPLLDDLKKVFKTETGRAITFPASGTGGWEAAITNTLSPGDKVLVARFGMFSHRWIDLCQRHKLDVEIIECRNGATGAPDRISMASVWPPIAEHKIKAVLVTHNETATGVVIGRRRGAPRHGRERPSCDALCGLRLARSRRWISAWMTGASISPCPAVSERASCSTTGMAIIGVSQKALGRDAQHGDQCPRTFFDFRDMAGANAKGGFPYTPPLQIMLRPARKSLDMLFEEGLDNVFARHRRIAERRSRCAVRKPGGWSSAPARPELYSETVSAIYARRKASDSDALTQPHLSTCLWRLLWRRPWTRWLARRSALAISASADRDVMALSGLATDGDGHGAISAIPIELGAGVIRGAGAFYRVRRRGRQLRKRSVRIMPMSNMDGLTLSQPMITSCATRMSATSRIFNRDAGADAPSYLDAELTGAELFFKCENFQRGRRVQGAGRVQTRCLGLSAGSGGARRRHALLRQSRALALLRRRSATCDAVPPWSCRARRRRRRRTQVRGYGGRDHRMRSPRPPRARRCSPRCRSAVRRRISSTPTMIRASSPDKAPVRASSMSQVRGS